MRTLTTAQRNAIANPNGVHMRPHVRIFQNRVYFKTLTRAPSGDALGQAAGISSAPLAQAASYSSALSDVCTVITWGGALHLYVPSHGTPIDLTDIGEGSLFTSDWSRPGFVAPYLWYLDTSATPYSIKQSALDLEAAAGTDHPGAVASVPVEIETTPYEGSLYALSDTLAVYLYLDEGGVGVRVIDTINGDDVYPYRFMWPGIAWDDDLSPDTGEAAAYLLHYAGVVERDGVLFIYITAPNGEVQVLKRPRKGIWGDMRVSVPQDLSQFWIGNAFVDAQDNIHLVGQFIRTDQFRSSLIWNMDLWSADGLTFSLDRFTGFSQLGYRFQGVLGANNVYYADTSRVCVAPKLWKHFGTSATYVDIPRSAINNLSGDSNSSWSITILDAAQYYASHALVTKGALAQLFMAIETGPSTWEDVLYDTCIISGKNTGKRNGGRTLSLELTNEALWRTSSLTYPFYLEMQSKQSIRADLSQLGDLAIVASQGVATPFACDFWGDEANFGDSAGLRAMSHAANQTKDVWTADLITQNLLETYPQPVAVNLPLTVNVYGWSRSGLPTTNPNTADSTPGASPADTISLLLHLKDEDDVERDVVVTTLATGNSYFPQTWTQPGTMSDGSLPIRFAVTDSDVNPAKHEKLVKIGVRFESGSAPTVFCPERIEIPDLIQYLQIVKDTVPDVSRGTPLPEVSDTTEGPIAISTHNGSLISGLTVGHHYTLETWGGYYKNGGAWNYISSAVQFAHGDANPFPTSGNMPYMGRLEDGGPTGGDGTWTDKSDVPSWCDRGENFTGPDGKFYSRIYFTATDTTVGIRVPEYAGEDLGWITDNGGQLSWRLKDWDRLPQPDDEVQSKSHFAFVAKGVPVVMFSNKPYTAFNFRQMISFEETGPNSWAGMVGLASDGHNYIGCRVTDSATPGGSKAQIFKVRADVFEVLAETAIALINGTTGALMFTHQQGLLSIYQKSGTAWPASPLLTYRWTLEDGPLAVNPDLLHTGTYTCIDTPKFRLCGTTSGADNVGLLGGYDPDALDDFPSSGKVEINGVIYNYTGKTTKIIPRGPYQGRNTQNLGSWTDDGVSYSGVSCDIAFMQWIGNAAHQNDWANELLATNMGYTWKLSKSDWQPSISTNGATVYLRDRSRHYGDKIDPNNAVTPADKTWLTCGLTGLSAAEGEQAASASEGDWCYLDTDNKIALLSYESSSGDWDAVIGDLLERVCAMAGARVQFPGDRTWPDEYVASGFVWGVQDGEY